MSPAGLIDIILPFLHLAVKSTALVGYTWNQAHIRYDVFKKLNEELPREDQIPSVEEKLNLYIWMIRYLITSNYLVI